MQRIRSLVKDKKLGLLSGVTLSAVLFLSACEYIGGTITPKNDRSYVASAENNTKKQQNDSTAYANTVTNMSGAKGISNRAYLTQEVQDSIYRLAKLHQTVSDIQTRMNVVAPSVEQLEMMKNEINTLGKKFDDIQMTLRQDAPAGEVTDDMHPDMMQDNPHWGGSAEGRPMNIIHADPAMASSSNSVHEAPHEASHEAPHKADTDHHADMPAYKPASHDFTAQVPAGATGLRDIRVGEHRGKTRIVLDMAKAVDIRYDLDNDQNIMVVELPGSTASNLSSKSFPKSPVLKGYDVQKSGDNTLVIFMFKKPTKLIENMQLKGTGKSAARYVFDMAK